MELMELARSRYSVRAYSAAPVEDETLKAVLEAGRLAPTACNLQAFRILVVPTQAHRDALTRMYRGAFFTQAPWVLGVYADTAAAWVRADGKSYADIDAAIVMDHMILAATSLGLGTCWIGAFNAQAARELGGFGDAFEPVAFTPLGYPASTPPAKMRKPLDDIVKTL